VNLAKIQNEPDVALYVDLDGTLIATDMLWESALALLRSHPLDALRMPLWLVRGKAHLKLRIAERVEIDAETLPYRADVLEYLREQRSLGRSLVLATASDQQTARAVADHLGIFDDVLASDADNNLKGVAKLRRVLEHSGGGFDYLGDSRADRPLWRSARRSLVVGTSRDARGLLGQDRPPHRVFACPGPRFSDLLRALRPHQWVKNLLLAIPLVCAQRFTEPALLLQLLLAIAAFSLAASAVYVLNDLLDLPSDRRHDSKRYRPFASGALPIPVGVMLIALLSIASVALTVALPAKFSFLLAAYLVLTTAYSLYLKQKLMVDVICLAGLYSIRILAGGNAMAIPVSNWLLAFSTFLFLSLALAKRYSELSRAPGGRRKLVGRGYMTEDLEMIRAMGPASGYLSALVFALYINNSPEVARLYHHPARLWLACPVLLYWISRVWFLAGRHQLDDDPVVFALKDRISHATIALLAAILFLAS
jgi:4-hydroxybenzoate polyprenyltransferase/phosphoserine phosphatase